MEIWTKELNFKLHPKMSKKKLSRFLIQILFEPVTESTYFLFSWINVLVWKVS